MTEPEHNLVPDNIIGGIFGPVRVGRTGVVVDEGATVEDLKTALAETVAMESGCKFAIGDLANILSKLTGAQLVEIAAEVQMKPSELIKIARVAFQTPPQKRRDGTVHFDFFSEAIALPEDRRDPMLDKVQEGEIRTPRVLRKSIQIGRVATVEDMRPVDDGDKGTDNVVPHVNRITGLIGRMVLEEVPVGDLYALHEDLLPSLEAHAKVIKLIRSAGGQEAIDMEADIQLAFK